MLPAKIVCPLCSEYYRYRSTGVPQCDEMRNKVVVIM